MPEISAALVGGLLDEINRFGRLDNGGVERIAWTPDEFAARRWLLDRCRSEGFEADMDTAGNVWAFHGSRPAVLLGSHLDTVPNGGCFDGALGIASALASLITARDEGGDGIGLVCFTDEEGVRFGAGMTGSRALAGAIGSDEIAGYRDRNGISMSDAMSAAGGDAHAIAAAAHRQRDVRAFMEVHIEQGRRLERAGLPVGIVSAIVGISHWQVTVTGEANHAGTTLPRDRHDALLPVATAALVANEVMRAREDLVATVGEAYVDGGAQNIVPGRAVMSLDVRAEDDNAIQDAVDQVLDALRTTAEKTGCEVEATETKRLLPAPMSNRVMDALESAARDCGLEAPRMPSMAGHDAMNLAKAGIDCGMVFVRSKNGISHSPKEHSDLEDCAAGATMMLAAALDLTAA